jgi:hypothetical protein
MTENADTCFKRLAYFVQPIVNRAPNFNPALKVATCHEIRASARAALEQDKEADNCAQF